MVSIETLLENSSDSEVAFQKFFEKMQTEQLLLTLIKLKPQYLLIYGRRSEYENDQFLAGKRTQQLKDNFSLMSYERLRPFYDCRQFITSKVHNQRYNVVSISPMFRYRADCAEVSLKEIQEWLGHSDISTTSNIYTHLNFSSKVASVNAILGVYPSA